METVILIEDIAARYTSRPRAFQAFEQLFPSLAKGLVQLRFWTDDLVSLSFVDELILRLAESNSLDSVVFVSPREDIRHKLAQIAAIRNAAIHFRSDPDQQTQLVEPEPTEPITIVRDKTLSSNT